MATVGSNPTLTAHTKLPCNPESNNSFALSSKSDNVSKNSKKFLIYRISWSLAFSIYVIFEEMNVFPDFGLYIVILFYFLAIFDIMLNIFSREIATEVGPGFMPKRIV